MPFPSLGELPDPGIEPRSPSLQADALPAELHRKSLSEDREEGKRSRAQTFRMGSERVTQEAEVRMTEAEENQDAADPVSQRKGILSMIREGDPVQQQRRFLVEYEDVQTGGPPATSVQATSVQQGAARLLGMRNAMRVSGCESVLLQRECCGWENARGTRERTD